jgi:hypothetical protein
MRKTQSTSSTKYQLSPVEWRGLLHVTKTTSINVVRDSSLIALGLLDLRVMEIPPVGGVAF